VFVIFLVDIGQRTIYSLLVQVNTSSTMVFWERDWFPVASMFLGGIIYFHHVLNSGSTPCKYIQNKHTCLGLLFEENGYLHCFRIPSAAFSSTAPMRLWVRMVRSTLWIVGIPVFRTKFSKGRVHKNWHLV